MSVRRLSLITMALVLSAPMWGKSKEEKTLPIYVLTAHTVAVIVDPQAGVDVEDPRANQVAQKDVETALANWGRFEMVMRPEVADLVIVVRKGHGRLVDETIPDSRQNSRAGVINPTNNGIQIGAQHGSPNPGSAPGNGPDEAPAPTTTQIPMPQQQGPQMELGGVEDSFAVYEGGRSGSMLGPPAWRKDEKDGLRSHNVPVVDEFRKALAEADKVAAAKKP